MLTPEILKGYRYLETISLCKDQKDTRRNSDNNITLK